MDVQDKTQQLYVRLLQYTPTEGTPSEIAPYQVLIDSFEEYITLHEQAAKLLPGIKTDLQKWEARLKSIEPNRLTQNDLIDHRQQSELARRVAANISELETGFEKRELFDRDVKKGIEKYHDKPSRVESTEETEWIMSFKKLKPEVAAWRKYSV